mmetsp:Transcript_33999/g.90579  ORF Transcript_33999/g.90579 Transcript_33999/m.90579 type:complete len:298 (-) Transcript_33999:1149-2042(-)
MQWWTTTCRTLWYMQQVSTLPHTFHRLTRHCTICSLISGGVSPKPGINNGSAATCAAEVRVMLGSASDAENASSTAALEISLLGTSQQSSRLNMSRTSLICGRLEGSFARHLCTQGWHQANAGPGRQVSGVARCCRASLMMLARFAVAMGTCLVTTKYTTRPREKTSDDALGVPGFVRNNSGAIQWTVPLRGFTCRVSKRARPKSRSFARCVKASTMMFVAFKSPCTIVGLCSCKYRSARQMPTMSVRLEDSVPTSWTTNSCSRMPSMSSRTRATPWRDVSMHAPCKRTMLGWRNTR